MPANSAEFDLAGIVRDKIANSEIADPKALSDALIEDGDIPKARYGDALRVTLPQYVREHVRATRRVKHRSGKQNMSQRFGSGYRYWRVHLGAQWVWLDDCTREDLLSLVDEYRRRAEENNRAAEEYESVISLFDKHNDAKVVADLPETEVRAILTPGVPHE